MECIDCPAKRLCDCGVKPKSCPKNQPPLPNFKDDDVMKMFNDLFGGKKK
jgi:hypothetical protein